ncbi:hypothetical protein PDN14_22085 [Bacillus cereus group sp. Bc222]|uniref:hypothetical protein n=1 Tax=Bacillus cereus group sp. Bc222 TaxID=3018111 RepID=UPI0022E120B1|nr:hypothetical protein [Bacillus cereus group sp. Bc222]MDA2241139.1 hypothetical protein [Bacillus cereus group sp. Bc222]
MNFTEKQGCRKETFFSVYYAEKNGLMFFEGVKKKEHPLKVKEELGVREEEAISSSDSLFL